MSLLEVKNISKQINENRIINNVSFNQNAFQKIAIAGESGAGKTTLLKMISGHVQPTSGTILFIGQRVIGPDEKLLPGHKHIGYLSQHYELLNNYRVEELIWFENKLTKAEAIQLFEICKINNLLHRKTNNLSGGEKQRIALCMLLIKLPKMLVLDEPFSNLDLINTNTLKHVLDDISEKLKITCLLTSHEPHDTLSWADEIIVMKDGAIVQQGTPTEIYNEPINEYVAGLFGRYNLLKPHIASLFGITSNNKTLIKRPGNFIVSKTGNGVNGTINKLNFQGSVYEAEVMIGNESIFVITPNVSLQKGDKVFISVNK